MNDKDYIIVMADVRNSRDYDQYDLWKDFKKTTESINRLFKDDIISPITITLGDEFQCVFDNISSAIKIIIEIEEKIVSTGMPYKLRYILLEGPIETAINRVNSYEMMGRGLMDAREKLIQAKSRKNRFNFYLKNTEKNLVLYSAFISYQDYVDDWRLELDYPVVSEFLKEKDYKVVAEKLGKTPSQIWKRERSLKMEQYAAIKEVIKYLGR